MPRFEVVAVLALQNRTAGMARERDGIAQPAGMHRVLLAPLAGAGQRVAANAGGLPALFRFGTGRGSRLAGRRQALVGRRADVDQHRAVGVEDEAGDRMAMRVQFIVGKIGAAITILPDAGSRLLAPVPDTEHIGPSRDPRLAVEGAHRR